MSLRPCASLSPTPCMHRWRPIFASIKKGIDFELGLEEDSSYSYETDTDEDGEDESEDSDDSGDDDDDDGEEEEEAEEVSD